MPSKWLLEVDIKSVSGSATLVGGTAGQDDGEYRDKREEFLGLAKSHWTDFMVW